MNVAALLHDSPSDDLRRRQARQEQPQEQPPQQQQSSHRPPHHSPPLERPRDQLRDRDRPPQDLPPPPHPHGQPPLAYRRSPPPLHPSRPPSPPRHAPPSYGAAPPGPGADFPAHSASSSSSQRHHLPPPSALLSDPPYEVVGGGGGHGTRMQRELGHPHDRLGPPPPGHSTSSVIQPFVVEHRTPSLPPKSQPHHHSHPHAHSHPSTPSSMYMPPPPGRSIHASPPTHHSSHGPGQGSIPLFPTPVGPGVPPSGPPMHAPPGAPPASGMSLRIGEPPPMYGSHVPSPHSHHSHHRDDRHRGRGSSTSSNAPPMSAGVLSSTASPVMASLQRPPPYDERERDRDREMREMERAAIERERAVVERERIERERMDRDAGPALVSRPRGHAGAPGPGLAAGPGSSLASMPSTPISPGPGRPLQHFLGVRGGAIPPDRRDREREREERSMGRGIEQERERRSSVSAAAVSPLESPETGRRERELRERELREREMRERELMEREREREKEKARQERQAAMKDRERQERHAQRDRELREQMQMQQIERERELRDREHRERMRQREVMEREQREREQVERERDGYRQHIHEMMGVTGGGLGLGAGPSMAEVEEREREREREREWMKQQKRSQQQQQQGLGHPDMRPPSQSQPPLTSPHEHHRPPSGSGRMAVMGPPSSQVWSRILPPQTGPAHEDERLMMEREQAERRRMEEMPPRELEWDAREAKPERAPRQGGRTGKSRTSAKDREERVKAAAAAAEGDERVEPQRRQRVSAREKEQRERERLERAEMEQREREQREMERREREREREQREFRMREHELAWRQEAELLEQERMQRAMHEDALRAGRAREAQGPAHGQQHLHHSHNHPHSAAGTPFGSEPPQAHPKLLSSKSVPMGATSLPQDLPPQYQLERERDFRHPPKGGPAQIQMGIPPHSQHHPHPQGPHPHQLGGPPHLRQDMYGPGPMSRRPSPPPFHPQSAPPHPAASMLPRTGSPPAPLVLPIRHLGTFVYPRTPFPFLDFPPSLTEEGAPADPLDIRATIFLPARFIPLTRPARPRIWGGALIPSVPTLLGTQRQLCVQFSGAHPQYGRPWPEEVREGRRVYTDDSDMFLCALHAGWVSWSQARKARREGRDLRMEVKLTREARFVGGFGNVLKARERGEAVEDLGAEDDGRELLSSGWGNGHDGAGVEILRAEFVLSGTAHSFGLRNRSQRMLEYAERRSALGCGSRSTRKRRRLLNGAFAEGESTVQLVVDQEDEELCDTRVMVFGTDSSWPEIGFKYHPDALKAILFPQSPYEGRPSKRRKLAAIADNASDTPPIEENSDDELVRQQRAVVVETLWESFLISQRGQIPSSELEGDKENASDAAASGGGRRYVIALLTNAGGTMGRLPKSTQRRRKPEQAKDVETADTAPGPIKAVPAADDPPQVTGTGGDVNGVAQSGGESPQKNGAPAVPGSGAGQVPGADADVDAKMSTSQDSQTHIDGAQPPESESIARTPSSSEESVDADEGSGPIQILHRDLGEENFVFTADGINVVSGEVVNGMRKGWKLEARQWKWVQVGVSS